LNANLAYPTQTLTFVIVRVPTLGTVTITNAATGAFTYTPGNYGGSDNFTFNATDSYGNVSNTAAVKIQIDISGGGGGGGGCPSPPNCLLVMSDEFGAVWTPSSTVGFLPLNDVRPSQRIHSYPDVVVGAARGGDLDRRRRGPVPHRSDGLMDRIHKNEGQVVGRVDA
jgi:hypothetical protein